MDFTYDFIQEYHLIGGSFEECYFKSCEEDYPNETGEQSWWLEVKNCRAVQKLLSDSLKHDFLDRIDKILRRERRHNKPSKISKRPFWEQLQEWLTDESWIEKRICKIDEAESQVDARYAKTVRNCQF